MATYCTVPLHDELAVGEVRLAVEARGEAGVDVGRTDQHQHHHHASHHHHRQHVQRPQEQVHPGQALVGSSS